MTAKRLDVLDGLRGIAILLVVWFHIWQISWLAAPLPWLQFIPETGMLGVDIFFFISGFVVSYPFIRSRLEATPYPTWGHFAFRRAIKIVPSYLLSIAVMYVIGYEHAEGSGGLARDLITHLLFVHNWFTATYGSINGVLWSLAVEVQFYCLFPLIAFAFLRRPFGTFACMMVIALAFREYDLHRPDDFYLGHLIDQLPAYFDVFACGMLAAWLFVYLRNKQMDTVSIRVVSTVLAIAGFAILVALMESLYNIRFTPNWSSVWKVVNRTWLALDCMLIAVGSLFAFGWWKKFLGNRVLVFFSIISYNLYIYHQVVARELWWHHLPTWSGTDPHLDANWRFWYTVVAFPAVIISAGLVTYLFERPILKREPPSWKRFVPREALTEEARTQ